jgi:hypothetical protein
MESISKTRSGKKYGVNKDAKPKPKSKPKSKPNPKPKPKLCSFCKNPGHSINCCHDQQLQNLHEKTKEACVFSYYVAEHTDALLKFWLKTLTSIELKALGYRFKTTKRLKINSEFERGEYINKLSYAYFWIELPWPEIDKLENISNKTFYEFKSLFLSNMNSIYHSHFEKIILILRPTLRRFNIEPILLCNETPKVLNKCNKSCPICLSDNVKCLNIVTTNCNHEYCSECMSQHLTTFKKNTNEPICACCRGKITSLKVKDTKILEFYKSEFCNEIKPPIQEEPSRSFITVIIHYIGF